MNANKTPERIKRSVLKRDYEFGGLKVTDLLGLNDALKLRQFFRASLSNHPIKNIQTWITEGLNYDHVINQEYSRLTNLDNIVNSSQRTLNFLTDSFRESITEDVENNNEIANFKISLIAATDVLEYLKRKKLLLVLGFFMTLFRLGIENYKQLLVEYLYPRSENSGRIANMTIKAFPLTWINIIRENIGCNAEIDVREFIMISPNKSFTIKNCTVKVIKMGLLANNKESTFPYQIKLGIVPHEGINPFLTARTVNFSTNLRIFKFRLLHMDIFTKERMHKYKMSPNNRCDFCDEVEDFKHVLWECDRAKRVWSYLQNILTQLNLNLEIKFENLFIGFKPTNNVIEGIITRLTQILLRINREIAINDETTKYEIISISKMYLYVRSCKTNDKDLWAKIIDHLK